MRYLFRGMVSNTLQVIPFNLVLSLAFALAVLFVKTIIFRFTTQFFTVWGTAFLTLMVLFLSLVCLVIALRMNNAILFADLFHTNLFEMIEALGKYHLHSDPDFIYWTPEEFKRKLKIAKKLI